LRPASEKRQGTKSRKVAVAVQRALWGFGRGVGLEEIGSNLMPAATPRASPRLRCPPRRGVASLSCGLYAVMCHLRSGHPVPENEAGPTNYSLFPRARL
jgi:hypothetical protein